MGMLCLARKKNQQIRIDGPCVVTVLSKNLIVDLDCLSALFRGEVPVGGNELPPEEVTARLYSIKEQRDHLIHSARIALDNLRWTIKNKQAGLVTGHDAQSLKVLKEALAKVAMVSQLGDVRAERCP